MRPLTQIAFVAIAMLAFATQSRAADASAEAAQDEVNTANNPLTPKFTINLQDYFLPALNRLGNRQANQFLLRGLVPSDAFGIPQLIRFTLPVLTSPTFPSGSNTGLGDLAVFDLAMFPAKGVIFGAGPLLVAPTASNSNLGSGKWQAGGAAVAVVPNSWGLLAGLITYQHSFAGDKSRQIAQVLTAQPIVTYNLANGYYLRSTGVWTFDLGNHTSVVPVGFGAGKVWTFGHGNSINAFVEPQYLDYPQRCRRSHMADLRRHKLPVCNLTIAEPRDLVMMHLPSCKRGELGYGCLLLWKPFANFGRKIVVDCSSGWPDDPAPPLQSRESHMIIQQPQPIGILRRMAA